MIIIHTLIHNNLELNTNNQPLGFIALTSLIDYKGEIIDYKGNLKRYLYFFFLDPIIFFLSLPPVSCVFFYECVQVLHVIFIIIMAPKKTLTSRSTYSPTYFSIIFSSQEKKTCIIKIMQQRRFFLLIT